MEEFTGEIICLEEVSAIYTTMRKTIKESDGRMMWQGVLCETYSQALVKAHPALTEIHAQSRSVPQQNLSNQDKINPQPSVQLKDENEQAAARLGLPILFIRKKI